MIPLILYPATKPDDRPLTETTIRSNEEKKPEAITEEKYIAQKTIAIKHNSGKDNSGRS